MIEITLRWGERREPEYLHSLHFCQDENAISNRF